VCEAVSKRLLRISTHALEEAQADLVSIRDAEESTAVGECIEDYPTDPRGPSCLVLTYLPDGSPIHVLWASMHHRAKLY
jgi:hypothetical protein